jgi:hypothetical protein
MTILCIMAFFAFGCAGRNSERKANSDADPRLADNWYHGVVLLEQLPPGVEMTKIEDGARSVTYHFRVSTPEQLQALQRLSQRKARPSFEHFAIIKDGTEFRL